MGILKLIFYKIGSGRSSGIAHILLFPFVDVCVLCLPIFPSQNRESCVLWNWKTDGISTSKRIVLHIYNSVCVCIFELFTIEISFV